MQEPLAQHTNSLHDWHIVSDSDLQGLDMKDSGMGESNMKQGEGDTNRQAHVLETPDTQKKKKEARSETSDKAVLYFYGGLTVVGVLLTMIATRRNPPLPSSEVSRTDDGTCGPVCSTSGNHVVPGIVYPTTDWNHTQYLPPGSSYSMYERMEKLEMESLRMQQELKSHSAAISDMDGRIRALETYVFGSSGAGVKGRLDTLKNQIDSLSKDVSQGNLIDGKPSPKSLQMLQNSESLSSLQEKVEHLELWLETLQHSSQTISSRLDSEMASMTEDVATLGERLHHVENHVHVSEDLL
mmetsp:Transcript_1543/g.3180  ORF Transcript_1543/g.3180 Transcript_1543/m.3180 type:complete len:297 (-) Transcript_1543:2945-3835(-)